MVQNDTAKALVQDNITKYTNNILDLLGKHEDMVMLDAEFNLLNRAVLSEIFYCDFLNVLMGWKLESANIERKNAPGIDLIDKTHKVAVQISLTCDHEKIQSSIDKFDKNWSRGSSVWHFYFVPLTDKVPGFRINFNVPANIMFDKSADVLTKSRISELAMIPLHGEDRVDRLKSVSDILDKLMREQEDHDEVCSDLFGVLQNKRKYHPSFTLLGNDDIDRRLFPGIEESKVMPAVGEKNGAVAPIWDLIEEEQKEGFRHIVIEGNGGIGKSVSLLSVTDKKELLDCIPAIYIHMYDLVSDGKYITVSEHINKYYADSDKIIHMAGKSGKPKLMVLLDGLNEVAYGLQSKLMKDIGEWANSNPGVQLIIASRPIPGKRLEHMLGREVSFIRLRPLEWSHVEQYLESCHIPVPDEKKPRLRETIKLPLFLTLYAKTARLDKETAFEECPLHVKEAVGPASLIWNYLQREILRQQTGKDVITCVLSCELIAPYVAYRMAANHLFEIESELADEFVSEAAHAIDQKQLPVHVSAAFKWFKRKTHNQRWLSSVNWPARVLDECGLFVSPEKKDEVTSNGGKRSEAADYAFMHQNFRDCLAALHLVNAAEAANGELPKEWKKPVRHEVLEYAAELMDKPTAAKLWEMNRVYKRYTGEKPKGNVSTYMQLELNQLLSTPGDQLNFSGMDIRGMNLTNYMTPGQKYLELFEKPDLSNKTHIDRKVFERVGHSSWINWLAVLPGGHIVSSSNDETLRIWDSDTGECLRTIEGNTNLIECLAVLPDGHIVSVSSDGKLRFWDPDISECLRVLKGQVLGVTCLAVLPDGRIVGGSMDTTIRIWDPDTGECLQKLEGHDDWVTCLAVLPDGRIVSGSRDKTLRIWDPDTGECLRTLEEHTDLITNIAALSNGRIVSRSTDGALRIWDEHTDKCLHTIDWVTCFAVLPDNRIVSGFADDTLRILDPDTGECLQTLEKHTVFSICLAVFPDGRIVSGSGDGALRIWNPGAVECSMTLDGYAKMIKCLIVLPDGHVASGSNDKTLRIWNPDTGECLKTRKEHDSSVTCLAVLTKGRFVSGSDDGLLRIWDQDTDKCLKARMVHADSVKCLAVFPDGRIVSGSWNNPLRIWNPNTGECLKARMEHAGSVNCLAVLSDGRIVSGSRDKTISIWEPDTGECLRKLDGHASSVNCLAVLSDGCIVSGSRDKTIRIWEPDTGECLRKLDGHASSVNCLAVLSNGRIVSGSDDKTLRIWDPSSREFLRTLEGHTDSVKCLAELPDRRIVSGSDDKTLRIWDSDTGKCLNVLEVTDADVSRMYLSNAIMDDDTIRILYQNMAQDHREFAKMYLRTGGNQ